MDWLIAALIIVNLYVIVYFRLMIGHRGRPATGGGGAGLLLVLSFPSRDGLGEEGLRYYRKYWFALLALVLLVVTGAIIRFPAITSNFGLPG